MWMTGIGRLRDLAQMLRNRWHGPLDRRLAEQQQTLCELAARLEHIERRLTAVVPEVDQLLTRRLAEQTRDLQDHLHLNAASIVAQLDEQTAAQAADATELRRFSRTLPASDRAA